MRNGAICGAEALLRWRHPSRGLLGPASFLDVLLDSPQELALTEWVVDTTCWHLSEWLTIGLPIPKVCLNLSARQLLAPNRRPRWCACASRTACRPSGWRSRSPSTR